MIKLKQSRFFPIFGLSVILASVFFPYQGEKLKTKALASSIESNENQLHIKQKTGRSLAQWVNTKDNLTVNLLTLKNANGMLAEMTKYGDSDVFYTEIIKSQNSQSQNSQSQNTKQQKSQNTKLQDILDSNSQVEKVAEGFKFTEGPLWHPDGFLLFSDIPNNTIYQWQPGEKPRVFRSPSGNANGNTFDTEGRLITGEHSNRRVSRMEKNGEVVTIASKYQGKRLNSPNDLAVKSDGSIYFTDPPYGIKSEDEELGFYGVYRLTSDGKLTLLVKDFVRPNGIAFSPDESKLYVNDSEEGHIRVFDVKPDGTLNNGRIFAQQKDKTKEGVPDGMKVDTKGNVYSTGPGGVWVFSPTGELLGVIEVPEAPANLAWGGQDYKTLYITAKKSVYSVRLKVPGVRPGGKE